MSSQRLQKVLAQAGIASRRAAEILITEGRVRVNGRIVRELGARANPDKDRVEVDGRRLVAQRHVYFLMHKPRGVVTTLDDPEGRKTVKDLLRNINERVFPVGRLDFNTSGALLLTNDGDLAQALLHPTRAVPKTYNAKLEGDVDANRIEQLREGVVLDDGHKTAPAQVSILRKDDKSTSLEITIAEGKNRQIHRMGEAIARTVLRLTRISFAGLTLEKLRPGEMRSLTALEVADLKQAYVHKAKRRRPFKAYGEMELDERGPLAVDGEADDYTPPPAWPEPNSAPAKRGKAGARERGARNERGADDDRGRLDERGTRDAQASRHGRGADERTKRDPRATRDAKTTHYGRGADERAKRDPRATRDAKATHYGRGTDERAKRDPRATRDAKATRYGRGTDERAKRDPRATRDARDEQTTRYGRGTDERAKRDPRATRDARDEQTTRYGRGAKRDDRATRYSRDDRTKHVDPRARRDPRADRGRRGARDKQDDWQITRDDRAKAEKSNASDPRRKRSFQDPRAKRDQRTASDPRTKRDTRTATDPRAKRDPRADYDQTEAPPRKHRGARTQPVKRTRSQSSATKRGPAPRKTRFKR